MTLHLANVTFDCSDPIKTATFWSAALGLSIDEGASPFFASIGRNDPKVPVNWLFAAVPEPRTAKSRSHLDMQTKDRPAEIARLAGLGATHVSDHDEWGVQWSVLLDPDGHEFCVAQEH